MSSMLRSCSDSPDCGCLCSLVHFSSLACLAACCREWTSILGETGKKKQFSAHSAPHLSIPGTRYSTFVNTRMTHLDYEHTTNHTHVRITVVVSGTMNISRSFAFSCVSSATQCAASFSQLSVQFHGGSHAVNFHVCQTFLAVLPPTSSQEKHSANSCNLVGARARLLRPFAGVTRRIVHLCREVRYTSRASCHDPTFVPPSVNLVSSMVAKGKTIFSPLEKHVSANRISRIHCFLYHST